MATVSLVVRREGSFLRPYAMKRFHHRSAGDPEIKQMFLDEARIAGLLRHPNVVSVLDVGEDATGPFLIMDYVEGVSLAQLIRGRQISAGEPVPAQIGLRILVQAAHGLAAAHELTSPSGAHLELVHRDVSPQNILLDLGGTVRIADFGIARAAGRSTETERGVLKGKLGYLAPETLQFADSDHRVDLFALGIVAFELFTGRRLYKGADVKETANRILHEPPPDLGMHRPDLPDGLVELVFRLLAKEPELRPATAREVAATLDHLLVDVVSAEGPTPLDEFVMQQVALDDIEARRAQLAAAMSAPPAAAPSEARPARPRWPLALGAVVTLAVIGGAALALSAGWSSAPEPDAARAPIAPAVEVERPPPSPATVAAPSEPAPSAPAPVEEPEAEAREEAPAVERPRPARTRRARRRRPARGASVPVVHEY